MSMARTTGNRCTTCHRDAHRPDTGWQGHYYTGLSAPEKETAMPNLKITATTTTPEQLAQVARLFRGQAWSWTPDRPIVCPTGTVTADGTERTVVGCGSANVWPSEEPGIWDCRECGIWFDPENETAGSPIPVLDAADGRPCELTYMIVVNVHPEDGEPDGDVPAGAPVEFYKLPDDVADTLKDLGNDYLREVNGVEPSSIRFLA